MKRYEIVGHTADTGLRVFGHSLAELCEHAAVGMFDIITDPAAVKSVGEFTIDLSAASAEDLMVDWLSELLYLHDAHDVLLGEFHVIVDGLHLTARALGEKRDPARHPMEVPVKAVTFHRIEVKPDEGYAFLILDV